MQLSEATVLVVDDEKNIRDITVIAMVVFGAVSVYEAPNGEVAWAIMRENPGINLVISDLEMPNLSGIGLFEKIQEKYTGNARFIMVTGYAVDDKFRQKLTQIGISHVLEKPVPLEDLRSIIEEVLNS